MSVALTQQKCMWEKENGDGVCSGFIPKQIERDGRDGGPDVRRQ
jgi:hypothetical protein